MKIMEIIGEIFGMVCAGFLFVTASKLFKKNKDARGIFVLVIGALILLCSFPWFQGWAKSFIASNISSKLTQLGEQVNTVQDTTTQMHKQLDAHQIEIDNHQKELNVIQAKIREAESNVFSQQSDITNQFHQISLMQSGLNDVATNLASQEKQLSDVEYWVENLYGHMTDESYSVQDTNHVFVIPSTNEMVTFFVRLNHAPIAGSVEAYGKDSKSVSEQRLNLGTFVRNITSLGMWQFDTNTTVLYFRYVADTRETNLYHTIPKLNEGLFIYPPNRWNIKSAPN